MLQEGWTRQGLIIPIGTRKRLAEEASSWGQQSIKILGTVAINLLMGMPEEIRKRLFLETLEAMKDRGAQIAPEETWKAFVDMVESMEVDAGRPDQKVDGAEPRWYVKTILDPELTPPPGSKASDKVKRRDTA